MGILKLARVTVLGLVLCGMASCGGGSTGGGQPGATGEPGATTFAKVYGANTAIDARSVQPTGDGYRVYAGVSDNRLALFDLDSNGNQVGNARVAQGSSSFTALNGLHSLLPDGRLNVSFDINRTLNRYTLHVDREQFSSDLDQSPSQLWQHAQVMDYGTTPWRSDEAEINGYPAWLQSVEVLQVETAVSLAGFQGAFVLLREVADVDTNLYGRTRRARILLFHYDSNGAVQSIKQVDERADPIRGDITEDRVSIQWVRNIKLAVAYDGSYAIAIPNLQVIDYYNYTTEYEVSAYDAADGLSWSQTLGPWQTNGTGGTYDFVSVSQMRVVPSVNVMLYLEGEHLRYLGLDNTGTVRWNLDLDNLNLLPVGLACAELGDCLFAALSNSPRHLLLWNGEGDQVGDMDLAGAGISNTDFRNFSTQLVPWPDRTFRLLLSHEGADPASDDRFLFHIAVGLTDASVSNQGDSLWRQAGDLRAGELILNPYGYTTKQRIGYSTIQRIYDSNNTLLFDASRFYAGTFGAPSGVAELADGRSLILAGERDLVFLRDGQIEQRLAAPGGLIPRSIAPLTDTNRIIVTGVNGWAVYNLGGGLVWSARPLLPEGWPYDGYASLEAAGFADGDLLLSGYIYGQRLGQSTLLYAARVAGDGSVRWQHTWTLGDDNRPGVLPLVIDDGQTGQAILAIANTSSASDQPAITLLKLDPASGGIIQRKDLSPRGAGGEIIRPVYRWWDEERRQQQQRLRLEATPQGGFWLGYTSSALVSHDVTYDRDGNPMSLPYGGDNMALIRFNAGLEPDRLRIYGAGGDEQLNDIHTLDDGGLLVAGETTSFALGWDGNEYNSEAINDAWILRLDASGDVSEGCPSLLASFDGAAASQYLGTANADAFAESSVVSANLTLTPFTVAPQLGADSRSVNMADMPLETARMCLGSVTPPPLPDPPADDYMLTLSIEGGPGAGSVSSVPTGIACPGDCNQGFASGTRVILTAAPGFGYFIAGWRGCDTISIGRCQVDMDGDRQITAVFETIDPPAVLDVLVEGEVSGVVTPDSGGSVSSEPTGIACPGNCSQGFVSGSQVTLTVAPDFDYFFAGWRGCDTVSIGRCQVDMDGDRQVTARFSRIVTPVSSSLQVVRVLDVNGVRTTDAGASVTSSPAGIACPGDCSEAYGIDTVVSLSAIDDANYSFMQWEGAGCTSGTVVMSQNRICYAVFQPLNHPVDLSVVVEGEASGVVTPDSGGSVSSVPTGIACPGDCSQGYSSGTQVTLTATPNSGYSFAGWSGAGCTTGVVTIANSAIQCTARFLANPVAGGDRTLTLTISGGPGAGEVYSLPAPPQFQCINSAQPTTVCTHSYPDGTAVSLVGQPYGATTLSWSGCDIANSDGCLVNMNADRQVTATFSP